jgi:polyisoprenoid-binding protein YceI
MRRRWWIVGLGALLAVILIGGFAVWYFVFRDDSPPAVSLERATRSIGRDDSTDSTTTASTGTVSGAAGLDGTWSVDSTIGNFADFSSSFAGYRVQEQLAGIGAKTAVGRTPKVTGSITIAGTRIPTATFEVDMTTLTSDDHRRDDSIRTQAIETARFPKASFTLTTPIELGQVPADGEKIAADATGDLTLHGVTKRVTIPIEAQRNGKVITLVGSLEIPFPDYSIPQPRSLAVLSVENQGIFEVQLHLTKTG